MADNTSRALSSKKVTRTDVVRAARTGAFVTRSNPKSIRVTSGQASAIKSDRAAKRTS
jgi:hypothetical protein